MTNELDLQLREAASRGNVDQVSDLLERKGADVNSRDTNGWTALHWAAVHNNSAVISYLIQKGVHVNEATKDGYTALQMAAVNNYFSVVACLMQHDADINATSSKGETVLELVKKYNHKETIKIIESYTSTSVTSPSTPFQPSAVKSQFENA
ncbi:uncharacterized protein LOC134180443 isoform X2 [Corticium candelabrum]|uniref:uncharacterized protein LOC134180443 isoform X2 n=1 Tax=Corticium candelabrum TaxID=121492 RepID=UPI002E274257|nr:uncharacterized protein LOC134180443 isoform X2 [Corticium candelabrum]